MCLLILKMKQRLSLENDKQSLEEELLFLREMHAKEIEELRNAAAAASMVSAAPSSDPATCFRSELATAIKRIREDYDTFTRNQRNELENHFRVKCHEMQRRSASAASVETPSAETISREQARRLKQQLHETKRNVYELKAKVSAQ